MASKAAIAMVDRKYMARPTRGYFKAFCVLREYGFALRPEGCKGRPGRLLAANRQLDCGSPGLRRFRGFLVLALLGFCELLYLFVG